VRNVSPRLEHSHTTHATFINSTAHHTAHATRQAFPSPGCGQLIRERRSARHALHSPTLCRSAAHSRVGVWCMPCRCVSVCVGVCRCVSVCVGVCRCVSVCVGVCRCVSVCEAKRALSPSACLWGGGTRTCATAASNCRCTCVSSSSSSTTRSCKAPHTSAHSLGGSHANRPLLAISCHRFSAEPRASLTPA